MHYIEGGGGGATFEFPIGVIVWPNYPVFLTMLKNLVKTRFRQFTNVAFSSCWGTEFVRIPVLRSILR